MRSADEIKEQMDYLRSLSKYELIQVFLSDYTWESDLALDVLIERYPDEYAPDKNNEWRVRSDEIPSCNLCGKVATIFDCDPCSEEIYPEEKHEEEWWCGECYQERLDDI